MCDYAVTIALIVRLGRGQELPLLIPQQLSGQNLLQG
jgi:hypothetical protein